MYIYKSFSSFLELGHFHCKGAKCSLKMNVLTFFFCSIDRDVRRRERGGGKATGPRAVVHELTLPRPHCPASAPRASLTPRPSLLSWPFDGTHVSSKYSNDTLN